jgi:hypothetical protein
MRAGARRRCARRRESSPCGSVRTRLRHKDFALYDRAELDEARRLMADLRLAGALRPSRRYRRSHRARPSRLRRTVRPRSVRRRARPP